MRTSLRSFAAALIAALAPLACDGRAADPPSPTATTPTIAVGARRRSPLAASLTPVERDRWYRRMSPAGARAVGLAPRPDPDGLAWLLRRASSPTESPLRVPQAVVGGVDTIVHDPTAVSDQEETSIAQNASGTILVAGYNDGRGFPDPAAADQVTLSLSGIARSTDGGQTWHEVPVGPSGAGTLPTVKNGSVYGDPDVRYDPTRDRFVYSSIYTRPSDGLSGMCVHVSNSGSDAGSAWMGPIEVGPAFIRGGSADKEFIDVNPSTGRVILTWTNFTSGAAAIMSTFSDDGGTTWSAAATIESGTGRAGVQDSYPRFVPASTNAASQAYVVYGTDDSNHNANVHCVRSTDGGATWSRPVALDAASFADSDEILGVDRVNNSPAIAVDPRTGRVYVVYQRDDASGTGDIALRTFSGACATGAPLVLSSNPGGDRAQFLPSVAVDASNGHVHVTWYDQDAAASGDVVQILHTMSTDQGATWSPPTPISDRAFHAGYGNDTGQPNLGDYHHGIAANGALSTVWAGTTVEPQWNEGLPAKALVPPDVYYDQRPDSLRVVPLRAVAQQVAEVGCASGGNGHLDPGESATLAVTLESYVNNATVGATPISTIRGTLSTATPGVTVTAGAASWSDLAPLATGQAQAPFGFDLASTFVVGTTIDFKLALTSDQGAIELPLRVETGTPAAAVVLLSEDFESATPPALPTGWTARDGNNNNGTPTTPWVSSTSFTPMTTKFAFKGESTGSQWIRLWSPTLDVPSVSGASWVTVDFDLAYRLEFNTRRAVQALDGMFLRITDVTGVSDTMALRSVLAEAFATDFRTGAAQHYPKHLPRSSDPNYFEDMSVWSGDSAGVVHVSLRFPGEGMAGRSAQLRFEYTQDAQGTCTTSGLSAPCGIAVDNVRVTQVPLVASACARPMPDLGAMPDLTVTGAMPDLTMTGTMPDLTSVGTMPDLTMTGAMPDLVTVGDAAVATMPDLTGVGDAAVTPDLTEAGDAAATGDLTTVGDATTSGDAAVADASNTGDAASGNDAAAGDGASAIDASRTRDATSVGPDLATRMGLAGGGATPDGCGCRVTGRSDGSGGAATASVGLLLVGLALRRRRREGRAR